MANQRLSISVKHTGIKQIVANRQMSILISRFFSKRVTFIQKFIQNWAIKIHYLVIKLLILRVSFADMQRLVVDGPRLFFNLNKVIFVLKHWPFFLQFCEIKVPNGKMLMSKFCKIFKEFLMHKAFTILYIVGKILNI